MAVDIVRARLWSSGSRTVVSTVSLSLGERPSLQGDTKIASYPLVCLRLISPLELSRHIPTPGFVKWQGRSWTPRSILVCSNHKFETSRSVFGERKVGGSLCA